MSNRISARGEFSFKAERPGEYAALGGVMIIVLAFIAYISAESLAPVIAAEFIGSFAFWAFIALAILLFATGVAVSRRSD